MLLSQSVWLVIMVVCLDIPTSTQKKTIVILSSEPPENPLSDLHLDNEDSSPIEVPEPLTPLQDTTDEGHPRFQSSNVPEGDRLDKDMSELDDEIAVSKEQKKNDAVKRKLVPSDIYLWPKGIVVYGFNASCQFILSITYTNLRAAMDFWEQNTCVKFVTRTDKEQYGVYHDNYVDIGTGKGCASVVGYADIGPQPLYLNEKGCDKAGTMAHELGHAMGLFHEQSRTDRWEAIEVMLNRVTESHKYNFQMRTSRLVAPYDLGSIMHYGPTFFASNINYDTIIAKDPHLRFLMGQRIQPTYYDYMTINIGYKCNAKCTTKPVCENHGYQDSSCACRCPYGLQGDICDTVVTSPWCGGLVQLSQASPNVTLVSPKYPENYNYSHCVWLLKGPKYSSLYLELNGYDISKDPSSLRCYHWLEMRYNLLGQVGPSFCGLSSKQVNQRSVSNAVLVYFDSRNTNAPTATGFNMTVSLYVERGCLPDNLPCKNGGICSYVNNKVECACLASYSGDRCQLIVDNVKCSFEDKNLCFMTQDTHDAFDWTIEKGATPSANTGPTSGSGGSGYYIFTEASLPRVTGDIAKLYITQLAGGTWCLKFQYHMHGANMGTLRLYLLSKFGVVSTDAYTIDGDQGNQWNTDSITVYAILPFSVVIEGIRSRGWSSDIALDDVSLSKAACTSQSHKLEITNTPDDEIFHCNFTDDMCGMSQDKTNDNFDWSRRSGPTVSPGTGPSSGYGGEGFYIYMEASSPRRVNDKAVISTKFLNYAGSIACVSFAVHGYGSGLGELTASLMYGDGSSMVVWGGKGGVNTDAGWLFVSFSVLVRSGFKVQFKAVQGLNYHGDYALDNITISSGFCDQDVSSGYLPVKCDFENGVCSMEHANPESLWARKSVTTPTGTTHLMSVSLTAGTVGLSGAQLQSPFFVLIGHYCMTFDYGIVSTMPNPLSVYLRKEGESSMSRIWTTDTPTPWSLAKVSVHIVGRYQFVFEGSVWSGTATYVLNNFSVTLGYCIRDYVKRF